MNTGRHKQSTDPSAFDSVLNVISPTQHAGHITNNKGIGHCKREIAVWIPTLQKLRAAAGGGGGGGGGSGAGAGGAGAGAKGGCMSVPRVLRETVGHKLTLVSSGEHKAKSTYISESQICVTYIMSKCLKCRWLCTTLKPKSWRDVACAFCLKHWNTSSVCWNAPQIPSLKIPAKCDSINGQKWRVIFNHRQVWICQVCSSSTRKAARTWRARTSQCEDNAEVSSNEGCCFSRA